MTHRDHVQLIKKAVQKEKSLWADFGSGEGAFTLALADIGGPDVEIISIDKDTHRLASQQQAFANDFPQHQISFINADFTKPLGLPPLDGIIAANSSHFVEDTLSLFRLFKSYLRKGGIFVVVEYNVDHGNPWVPYPFSFHTFQELATQAGFSHPTLLETIPSSFLDEIYSGMAVRD